MTPQNVSVPHNPPVTYGDCTRACIASILDLDIEDVPHFMDLNNPKNGWDFVDTFLKEINLGITTTLYDCSIDELLNTMGTYNSNLYYLLGCASRIADHLVVCLGNKVVWNPGFTQEENPRKNLGKDSQGYLWVYQIVPLKMIKEKP